MSAHKEQNSIGNTPWAQLSIGKFREAMKKLGERGQGGRKPQRAEVQVSINRLSLAASKALTSF